MHGGFFAIIGLGYLFASRRFVLRLPRLPGLQLVQRERLLRRNRAVQLGLRFIAQQSHELRQRHRLFGGIDYSFDLSFQAHG